MPRICSACSATSARSRQARDGDPPPQRAGCAAVRRGGAGHGSRRRTTRHCPGEGTMHASCEPSLDPQPRCPDGSPVVAVADHPQPASARLARGGLRRDSARGPGRRRVARSWTPRGHPTAPRHSPGTAHGLVASLARRLRALLLAGVRFPDCQEVDSTSRRLTRLFSDLDLRSPSDRASGPYAEVSIGACREL